MMSVFIQPLFVCLFVAFLLLLTLFVTLGKARWVMLPRTKNSLPQLKMVDGEGEDDGDGDYDGDGEDDNWLGE